MIFERIAEQYRRHLKRFFADFDSIKEIRIEGEAYQGNFVPSGEGLENEQSAYGRSARSKVPYLLGMIAILYVGLDSALIIFDEGILSSRNWTAIGSLERLFPHRIFPATFWYQAEITVTLCLGMAALLFALLALLPALPQGACLYAYTDRATGQVLKLVSNSGEG